MGAKQIVKSQASPPRNRAPAFDADEPRDLLVDREASRETANIESDVHAGGQPIQSQMPSGDVARIGSRSVVVVLERSNLRFGVRRYRAMWRVERLGHVVVDTKSVRQERSSTRERCHRSSPEQQNVAPGAATQHLRIDLDLWERSLSEKASSLIVHWPRPPAALLSLTSLRSCCAAYPNR